MQLTYTMVAKLYEILYIACIMVVVKNMHTCRVTSTSYEAISLIQFYNHGTSIQVLPVLAYTETLCYVRIMPL